MRCRVCKCTDDRACAGGCYWAEDNLCSTCAAMAETLLAYQDRVPLFRPVALLKELRQIAQPKRRAKAKRSTA